MTRGAVSLALGLMMGVGGAVQRPAGATTTSPAISPTSPAILAADAAADVLFLTSPALEGRGVMTSGLVQAGAYIARRFVAAGLSGGVAGGGFFQPVDVPVPARPGPRTALVLGNHPLQLGRDFVPGAGAAATRALGGIVFVGHGLVAKGRDDYRGVDARGKLVVALVGGEEPAATSLAAGLLAKVGSAIDKGAVGVAFVDAVAAELPDPASLLAPPSRAQAGNIASFFVSAAAVDRLLAPTARTVASITRALDQRAEVAAFELGGAVSFEVEWVTPVIRSRNVVAFLEGSDPVLRDEVVAIGAHYDHLGQGDEGNSLDGPGRTYPGGDDNASGTAALLEIAEAFAAKRARPRRSLLFAAFTGEEKGLLGSLALARAAGRQVVAMINLDMIGRLTEDAVEVGGASTSPGWRSLLSEANLEGLALNLPLRVVPNSDHAPFLARQIPSLFLFTGLHGDYHRVSDTGDKVNTDGVARVARLVYRLARATADQDQRLTFVAPIWTAPAAVGGSPTVPMGGGP